MAQTLLEKLQLTDENNLLIQGLPSSIEKDFIKLTFSKNVTPLLKKRKIDFALVFAVSQIQLTNILKDVIPYLSVDAKLWISYPKQTSKITSDLAREKKWKVISQYGYEGVRTISMDNVWTASRFKIPEDVAKDNFCSTKPAPGVDYVKRRIMPPAELELMFTKNKKAANFFESLAFTHKREYVEWILSAKKEATKQKRLQITIEKLIAQKKSYNDK